MSHGSKTSSPDGRQARMAEVVRLIVTRRERAPRSPRLERALKRLIWRYTREQEGPQPKVPPQAEEREEGMPAADAGRE